MRGVVADSKLSPLTSQDRKRVARGRWIHGAGNEGLLPVLITSSHQKIESVLSVLAILGSAGFWV